MWTTLSPWECSIVIKPAEVGWQSGLNASGESLKQQQNSVRENFGAVQLHFKRAVWRQDCWFVALGCLKNNNTFCSNMCYHVAILQNKTACEREIFWQGCPWWQTFDVFWLDCSGGGGLSKAKRNQCSFNKEDLGGRQTVLFMTGPVSALSRSSQIPETGKYCNCKHPWLDRLRRPPVRFLPLGAFSPTLTWPRLHKNKNHKHTHLLQLRHNASWRRILRATCILQLPSQSTVILISQDVGRCSRAAAPCSEFPVINPRLHPVPLPSGQLTATCRRGSWGG